MSESGPSILNTEAQAGDSAQLNRLPSPSLSRRLLRVFSLLSLLWLLAYGFLAARFHFSSPKITRNYAKALEITSRSGSDSEGAYPIYRAFYIKLYTTGIYKSFPAATHSVPDLMPGEIGWTQATEFSRICATDLPLVRAATKLPFVGAPLIDGHDPIYFEQTIKTTDPSRSLEPNSPDPALIAMPLRHLSWCRHIGSNLMLDARVSLIENDIPRYFQNVIATLHLYYQLESEPSLMSSTVRLTSAAIVTQELRRLLTDTPTTLSESQLIEISHALAKLSTSSLQADLATESVFIEDWLQRSFTDDGHGDGRFVSQGFPLLPVLAAGNYFSEPHQPPSFLKKVMYPIIPTLIAGRKEFHDAYKSLVSAALIDATIPRWQRPPLTTHSMFDLQVSRAIFIAQIDRQYRFDESFRRGIHNYENFAMDRDATLTAIALELFRRQTGHFPQNLSELVPALLPSLPIDIWDSKPLKYKLVDNMPLLYTIGSDLSDNGGLRSTDHLILDGTAGCASPQSMNKDWVFLPHVREPH